MKKLRDMENLMIWNLLRDQTFFMSKKFRDARTEFDKVS